MKSKKDISDLIRDNQHKLEERPNPRAWERLEEKLDQHEEKGQGGRRIVMYRRLAMAAAVVAMVAVISIINTQSSSSEMAKAEANISPQDQFAQGLEPVYSEEDNNLRQVIEFKRKLKDRYANPIQEGTQTKKLLASNNRNTIQKHSNFSTRDIARNEKPSPVTNNSNNEVASSIAMEINESEMGDSEVIEDVTVMMDQPIAMDAAPPAAAPAPEMARKKESKAKKEVGNFATSKIQPTGIQTLNWMKGNWTSKNKRIDILFLNNSDLVSSDFKIKEIGNELFFIANDITYEFVESVATQTIFEQKNKDQIILEKMDGSQFSITLVKFNSGQKVVDIFKKQ